MNQDEFEAGVGWFKTLDPEVQETISSKLATIEPELTLEDLARSVAKQLNEETYTSNLIAMVSWVSRFVGFDDPKDKAFQNQVCNYLAADDEELGKRFKTILNSESLVVTKKAQAVMWGHGRVFKDAQVISQIRPVFFAELSKPPQHAVIVHELRVEALNNNEEETWRIAMDVERARNLITVLERAIEKEEQLREAKSFKYLKD